MSERMNQQDPLVRLQAALDAHDDMTCAAAQAQIAALVEAELAGEDSDTMPEFAALLHHLDRWVVGVEPQRPLSRLRFLKWRGSLNNGWCLAN